MLVLNDVFEMTHYEPSRTVEPNYLFLFLFFEVQFPEGKLDGVGGLEPPNVRIKI